MRATEGRRTAVVPVLVLVALVVGVVEVVGPGKRRDRVRDRVRDRGDCSCPCATDMFNTLFFFLLERYRSQRDCSKVMSKKKDEDRRKGRFRISE